MAKKLIKTMITAFRDGFQSVYGARVLTKDFLPALEAARAAGFNHFEAGGGARFQALYFYCQEDAFAMMDEFRRVAGPQADLQTLARGINVVGLESQSSEVIKLHAQLFKKHGMSTIRNFDALNDVDNLIYSGRCIVEAGLKHEVCVTVMELPPGLSGAHDEAFYTKTLRAILDAGVPYDSVCFKDATGTLTPRKVHAAVKAARQLLGKDTKLVYHSHETAGIGTAQYLAALEAGADQIDLSLAPLSGGTAQTDVITMWHALRGSDFDLGVDIAKVVEAERQMKDLLKDYFLPPEATQVEPLIPFFPMPGGALTANTQMLRDNGLMHKYTEVSQAMGEVVAKGGFGTSVTPVSQFYFQQAFNNVLFGPWKKAAEGYALMVLGYFGKTPVAPDPAVVKWASEQLGKPVNTESPLALNDRDPAKSLAAMKDWLVKEGLRVSDENLFIAATCRDKGLAFLKGQASLGVRKIEPAAAETAPAGSAPKLGGASAASGPLRVTVEGRAYVVEFKDGRTLVDGQPVKVAVEPASEASLGAPSGPAAGGLGAGVPGPGGSGSGGVQTLQAPLPGLVLRLPLAEGHEVGPGEPVLVLESMKMEMPVNAEGAGRLLRYLVKTGEQVVAGQALAQLEVR